MADHLIYPTESYSVIGACLEVYKNKGCGFLESVYQECVEIKAVSQLIEEHRAQTMNYLKAAGYKLALLINFGHYPLIEKVRIANTSGRLIIEQPDSI